MKVLFGSWKPRVGRYGLLLFYVQMSGSGGTEKFLALGHNLNSPIIHSFRNTQLLWNFLSEERWNLMLGRSSWSLWFTESQNCLGWKEPEGSSMLLPWAGTSSMMPGLSKPIPSWPWTFQESRGSHIFSGEGFLLNIQYKPIVYQWEAIPPSPFAPLWAVLVKLQSLKFFFISVLM